MPNNIVNAVLIVLRDGTELISSRRTERTWMRFLHLKNSRIWEMQISITDYRSLPSGPPARSSSSHFKHITRRETRNGGCTMCTTAIGQSSIATDSCSNGGPEHEKYAPKDYELEFAVFDLRVRHTTACEGALRLDSSLAGADPLRRRNHFDGGYGIERRLPAARPDALFYYTASHIS